MNTKFRDYWIKETETDALARLYDLAVSYGNHDLAKALNEEHVRREHRRNDPLPPRVIHQAITEILTHELRLKRQCHTASDNDLARDLAAQITQVLTLDYAIYRKGIATRKVTGAFNKERSK